MHIRIDINQNQPDKYSVNVTETNSSGVKDVRILPEYSMEEGGYSGRKVISAVIGYLMNVLIKRY